VTRAERVPTSTRALPPPPPSPPPPSYESSTLLPPQPSLPQSIPPSQPLFMREPTPAQEPADERGMVPCLLCRKPHAPKLEVLAPPKVKVKGLEDLGLTV